MIHMLSFDLTHIEYTTIITVMLMSPRHSVTAVAIIGDYDPHFPPHPATTAAVLHSAHALGINVRADWISTEVADVPALAKYSALWIAPGSPYKNMRKTLDAIRYARESNVPCLGTCGGLQHIVIEYARNVLGYVDAQHAEYEPSSSALFISALACSPAGREMHVALVAGSKVAGCYGSLHVMERYYCNFGVNPLVVPMFSNGPMRIVGSDEDGEVRVLELEDHPFFVATLFVPQNRSRTDAPHPLVTSFISAAHGAGILPSSGDIP